MPERRRLRRLIDAFVAEQALLPPLSMEELSDVADGLIRDHGLDPSCKGWIMVEVNNGAWKGTVASIPYEKRILLLPKCLSHSTQCEAETDEFGLLCHQCKRCSIAGLEEKAERLGVMSMVAEGFTSVIGLVESGAVETVIGVGCLDSLEKAFPLLINNAVAGMAIPLNGNGCINTQVDTDYVREMITMQSDNEANLLDYGLLKSRIKEWFTTEALEEVLSTGDDRTTAVAREWMGGDGKRWRPYLLAATYMAVSGKRDFPGAVRLASVAVECFHKASLVHDDIQDNDRYRYGKETVHAAHGMPVAINVGDILLGEGYKLLAGCGDMELVKEAAAAHISLCKGQGMELEWSLSPRPVNMDTVLEIFCNKTVPAFDVSLIMGVTCAGGDDELKKALHVYSRALGIAYQLRDDIEDYGTESVLSLRPSAILAALCEQHPEENFIKGLLACEDMRAYLAAPEYRPVLEQAIQRVRNMADDYHRQALEALKAVRNVELKRLLFRVTGKILTPSPPKGGTM